jgi:DNA-binding ferritin-like protein
MKELMILLRAMQMYSQNAHHLSKGMTFMQDHSFFGDTYEQLGDDFDDVSERIVGLYGEEPLHLQTIMKSVVDKLMDAPSVGSIDNKIFYQHQLHLEDKLCDLVKMIVSAGCSKGTEQLITEISNKSEIRKYKIKQRLK